MSEYRSSSQRCPVCRTPLYDGDPHCKCAAAMMEEDKEREEEKAATLEAAKRRTLADIRERALKALGYHFDDEHNRWFKQSSTGYVHCESMAVDIIYPDSPHTDAILIGLLLLELDKVTGGNYAIAGPLWAFDTEGRTHVKYVCPRYGKLLECEKTILEALAEAVEAVKGGERA